MTALIAAAVAAAAAVSALLNALLRPMLFRYALARPNARSSHATPTPQGGGIGVVAAILLVGGVALAAWGGPEPLRGLAPLAAAAVVLAMLGGVDDVRPLPALPRLVVQGVAVGAALLLADPGRVLPDAVPLAAERVLLVVAGLWWVNLVNFMDGLDWMSVAEFVPLSGALVLLGIAGQLPPDAAVVAATLLGAVLGFAPSNRPVARLFLGDVGSLPLGLVSGWLLLALAASGAMAAALLLPLYYLADATLTLAIRLRRGERVWEAHRSHFYQRARANGRSVLAIDGQVGALNLALAAVAGATILWPGPLAAAGGLAAGATLVGFTLRSFARPPAGVL